MKALVKTAPGPGNLELIDRPIPVPKAGQVRIRVKAAGVCGTDLHVRDATYPSNPPVTLGHELSGVIDELGEGVTGINVGDRVTSETYFTTCGHCHYCVTGHENRCLERKSIGSGVDGAMAEYVIVPAHRVHLLPEKLSFEEGAAIEPYICCVHAVMGKTPLKVGDPVLVSGPGIMGLLCVQLLRQMGCRIVLTGTKKDEERLALGREFGADLTLYVEDEGYMEKMREFSGGLGMVASFECSGAPASVTTCLDALQKGGTLIQVSLPDKKATIDMSLLVQRESTIIGSFATLPEWWNRGIELLEKPDGIVIKPLITEALPLEKWEEAFSKLEHQEGYKFVLIP